MCKRTFRTAGLVLSPAEQVLVDLAEEWRQKRMFASAPSSTRNIQIVLEAVAWDSPISFPLKCTYCGSHIDGGNWAYAAGEIACEPCLFF